MTASLSSEHRSTQPRSAEHLEALHSVPLPSPRPPLHLVSPEGQLQIQVLM